MANNLDLTQEKYDELADFISELPDKKGKLVKVLHKAQGIFGYLPREVQEFVGKQMGESAAKVYGIVSFYTFFHMEPKGEHDIHICLGTACFVRGAKTIKELFEEELGIKDGETTADGKFSITGLRCIGACGLAPVLTIGDKTYARLTPDRDTVKGIIAEYR